MSSFFTSLAVLYECFCDIHDSRVPLLCSVEEKTSLVSEALRWSGESMPARRLLRSEGANVAYVGIDLDLSAFLRRGPRVGRHAAMMEVQGSIWDQVIIQMRVSGKYRLMFMALGAR